MNDLEKLYSLLAKSGRLIKYGEMVDETSDPIIAIKAGEGEVAASHLRDANALLSSNIIICVYASDYMAGYNLAESLKAEIKSAVKDSVKISYNKDLESVYETAKQRYVFKTVYKILKI